MKDEIENILGMDIPSTNKLVLIYFKLNGNGCIQQTNLANKLCCSRPGINNSIRQLAKTGLLKVDHRAGKQSYYSILI